MKSEIFTTRFVKCPNGCDHKFQIDHLLTENRKAGPWYCDLCYQGFNIETINGEVFLTEKQPTESDDGKSYPSWVILEIPPQKESIVLKVKGIYHKEGSINSNDKFHYEENTCPVNYFKYTENVFLGDDSDPHGLANYITSYPTSDDEEYNELPEHVKSLLLNNQYYDGWCARCDLREDKIVRLTHLCIRCHELCKDLPRDIE